MLSTTEIAQFNQDGFVIVRGLADASLCQSMRQAIQQALSPALAPLEFETDVDYPGSPTDRLSPGGDTPRRLLNAFTRDRLFRDWATSDSIITKIQQLLNANQVSVSQNHHNCIMTKHPGYSSATLWHQDIRYWMFDKPDLVSVWLALGDENKNNGGMQLIPESHKQQFDRGRFDGALFLRQDLKQNQALISSSVEASLQQGDVLFFHSKTLHAAGCNNTDQVKISLVFSYRDSDNKPIVGTRSANYPDIPC